jgi:plastocyanin
MIVRPNHTRLTVLLAALAALVLVLAACTGDSGSSSAASASALASTPASTEPSAAESTGASDDGSAGGTTVTLTGFAFDTDEITISAGDTVTFVNEDSAAHTVTEGENGDAADGARFDEQIAGGESTDVTFDEAGDYNVTCLFHGNMNMVVHVE